MLGVLYGNSEWLSKGMQDFSPLFKFLYHTWYSLRALKDSLLSEGSTWLPSNKGAFNTIIQLVNNIIAIADCLGEVAEELNQKIKKYQEENRMLNLPVKYFNYILFLAESV
jgi:hypothetical protein